MIIGITGLPCSGADSLAGFLVELGFIHLNYSDLLKEELRKRGTKITRESMQGLGNEIRDEFGMGELSKRLISKMDMDRDYVVGTIRNPGEVEELRKVKDFFLVKILAKSEDRFKWILSRGREGDPLTFEEFILLDYTELGNGQKKTGLRIKDAMDLADFTIENYGSLEELRGGVVLLVEKFRKEN